MTGKANVEFLLALLKSIDTGGDVTVQKDNTVRVKCDALRIERPTSDSLHLTYLRNGLAVGTYALPNVRLDQGDRVTLNKIDAYFSMEIT